MENNEDKRQMTVLSELLNWIDDETILGILPHPRTIRMKIESLLPKERESLEDAYSDGRKEQTKKVFAIRPKAEWFSQTYTQDYKTK